MPRKQKLINENQIKNYIHEITGGGKLSQMLARLKQDAPRDYVVKNTDALARAMAADYLCRKIWPHIMTYIGQDCMLAAPYKGAGLEIKLLKNADPNTDYYFFLHTIAPDEFSNRMGRAAAYLTGQATEYINAQASKRAFSFDAQYLVHKFPTIDQVISKTKWMSNPTPTYTR